MGLKRDINLLKQAGSKQKVDNKSSMLTIIVVVLVLAIIGVGVWTFSLFNKKKSLESDIARFEATIADTALNKNVEAYKAVSSEISSIQSAIGTANALTDYKEAQNDEFPKLIAADELSVKNAVIACNAQVTGMTYKGSNLIITIKSNIATNEKACIDAINATHLLKADKVGFLCGVCGEITYGAGVCANTPNHIIDENAEVVEETDETGYTFSLSCIRKTYFELITTAPIATPLVIITADPSYNGNATLTVSISSYDRDALLNFVQMLEKLPYVGNNNVRYAGSITSVESDNGMLYSFNGVTIVFSPTVA